MEERDNICGGYNFRGICMKKLYRSEEDQMIGGVCGGIGEYFDIDPTIVRIAFVLVMFPTVGFGFVIYILCWAIIPSKSSVAKDSEDIVKENTTEMKKKFDTLTDSVRTEVKSDTSKSASTDRRKERIKKSSK